MFMRLRSNELRIKRGMKKVAMIMKRYLIPFVILGFLQGCTRTVNCYPIRGPLYDSGKIQPIQAKFFDTGFGDSRAKVELVTPWGEKCIGEYSMARNDTWSLGFGSANVVNTSNLGSLWTTVYGNNFTLNTSGKNYGMATLIGDQGTVIEAEFISGGISGHGFGVAKDNRDNYYRIHF